LGTIELKLNIQLGITTIY